MVGVGFECYRGQDCAVKRFRRPLFERVRGKLYERLKSASGYRFAVAGLETFQFNDIEALAGLIDNPALTGLVVNQQLFQQLGRPSGFVKFIEENYLFGGHTKTL